MPARPRRSRICICWTRSGATVTPTPPRTRPGAPRRRPGSVSRSDAGRRRGAAGGAVHAARRVSYRRRLDDLPNQRLAADLAAGLVAATHPHGPIRTRSVASQYVQTARRMVRELHAGGFCGGLSELSRAVIVEYWLGCDFHRERRLRAILAAFAAAGGVLDAGVGRHLQGRRINQVVKSRPNPPYSDGEWRRLSAACTELITSSRRAPRQVLALIEGGADPAEHDAPTDTQAARLLHQSGPATAATILDGPGPAGTARIGRVEVLALRRALYPDADTAL